MRAFDWTTLWDIGGLVQQAKDLAAAAPDGDTARDRDLLRSKLALLVLEVLHYGGFKGENFWFGLWKPARSPEAFVRSSQDRQYRLHKDAIEMYLNAGVVGPITGYFSFMFRDGDWQAPTWGVVDAAWVPKKAYRAYVESNHPVRVTLPAALRSPVKLVGDRWLPTVAEGPEGAPWASAAVIVANDTSDALPRARVDLWLEDAAGLRLPPTTSLTLDLGAGTGWSGSLLELDWPVEAGTAPGTYFLKARISSAGGEVLSTNSYELLVLDTDFPELATMTKTDVKVLLDGRPKSAGFHFWQGGAVVYRARPGLRGLVRGHHEAQQRGIDLYETVQGEHLFRHVLGELASLPHGDWIADEVWRVRSEVVSPAEKSRVLLRYLGLFVDRAEARLAQPGPMPRTRAGRPAAADPPPFSAVERAVPVGRDLPVQEEQ